MSDYILNSVCGVCQRDVTVLPVKYYTCEHKYCLKCIYHSRNNEVFETCPTCRSYKIPNNLISCNSPVITFPISEDVNKIVEDFIGESLGFSNIIHNLIGKLIIVKTNEHYPEKNIHFQRVVIGLCINLTQTEYTLRETFVLSITEDIKLYPTYPEVCTFSFENNDIVYITNTNDIVS